MEGVLGRALEIALYHDYAFACEDVRRVVLDADGLHIRLQGAVRRREPTTDGPLGAGPHDLIGEGAPEHTVAFAAVDLVAGRAPAADWRLPAGCSGSLSPSWR